MLRRLVTSRKPLVIVPVVLALVLAGLFLPVRVSIEPYGVLSLESKITISIGYEAAYASPDTERQSPDAILELTNLSPNDVSYLQDDPDSPDVNWLVAPGNNVNTDVRVSFPTPTGNPTVGADLQGFKAWVRQFDENQGLAPEVRLELWEDGVLIRAGPDEAVPDGGKLISFTWNANEIATVDGSLVECKVVGTKSGGSPSNRNAVDVGAIEWNVNYTAAPPDISNLPISKDFGTVSESTSYWSYGSAPVWPLDDAECFFEVTNNSSSPVNIAIRATNFSGGTPGWTLAGTPAGDTVTLKAGKSGDALETNMVILTTSDQAFITLLGASSSKKWELKMETPTSFSNGDSKTSTVTLTATFP